MHQCKREINMNVWNTKLTLEYKEALTFIVVKTIKIINGYITEATDPLMDPLQFVYRTTSIWNSNTSARPLCADFLAFTTTQGHVLTGRLTTCFHIHHYLTASTLTNRSQRVLVKSSCTTYVGTPQDSSPAHRRTLSQCSGVWYLCSRVHWLLWRCPGTPPATSTPSKFCLQLGLNRKPSTSQ